MNRVTLELAEGRVIYVRCHETDAIPGKYREAFALEETFFGSGVWEAKIALESLTIDERRDFEESALATKLIQKVIWKRYEDGRTKFREIEKKHNAH